MWALIHWWPDLYDAIPKNSNREIITGALFLFAVPLIVLAWPLRILVRVINSAITLGEDTEHRKAMLETYFALVGDKEAGMEPSDRILVLNAIFRPLPGQSSDVNPPTILELAREVAAGGKGH